MSTYRQKESLKRTGLAILGTLLFHMLLLGILYWSDHRRSDLDLYSGPVRITLGDPEGQDVPRPEISEPAEEPAEEQPEAPETPREEPEPVEEPRETEPVAPREEAQEPVSRETPAESSSSAPDKEQEVQVKGETYGNTHLLNLESAGGQAGRNLWTPIYLYMPMSHSLDQILLAQATGDPSLGITAEDDRRLLLRYYRKTSDGRLELKVPLVPLDERPDLWIALERMGYDLSRAEYKTKWSLDPVEIHFTVSSSDTNNGGSRVELIDLTIEKSSGIPQIDQAVLYGLTRSSYYNDSERELKGRFVYRFR